MEPLVTMFTFLVLKVPLLVHAQNQESNVNSTGVFFQNGALPVSCNMHIGADWYGGDMIQNAFEHIDSPGECCTLCRERTGCRAWLWRSGHRRCWLKHTVPYPRQCPECVGGILHHVVPGICNPRAGTGWSGPNLEVRIGTTLGDCCDACYQRPTCTGWTFRNTTSPRCFLKERNDEETSCADCISGEDEYVRPINESCNAQNDTDWLGNDINAQPYINVSAAGCCEMCQNRTDCRVWLYRTLAHHCYLKSAIGPQTVCVNCVGGIAR